MAVLHEYVLRLPFWNLVTKHSIICRDPGTPQFQNPAKNIHN